MTARSKQEKQQDLNRRLEVAVTEFKTDEVRRLLEQGADASFAPRGEPLLCFAAAFDIPETINLLIDNGADVNACDSGHRSPLDHALDGTMLENAALLMARGADLNRQERTGETPPPYYSAIHADQIRGSTVTTKFILALSPDFSLRFNHAGKKGQAIEDMLNEHLETCAPENKAMARELRDLVMEPIETERFLTIGRKQALMRQNALRQALRSGAKFGL